MNRLSQLPTLRIDSRSDYAFPSPSQPSYQGLAGDTIATALYANGRAYFFEEP